MATPSLNGLRAFEAAGRHKSFTLAADELHVTPGAVSRQIKALEDALGIPLFVRSNREVTLTPESKAYLDSLTDEHFAGSMRPPPTSATRGAKSRCGSCVR